MDSIRLNIRMKRNIKKRTRLSARPLNFQLPIPDYAEPVNQPRSSIAFTTRSIATM
jgi:hypothetical protein